MEDSHSGKKCVLEENKGKKCIGLKDTREYSEVVLGWGEGRGREVMDGWGEGMRG